MIEFIERPESNGIAQMVRYSKHSEYDDAVALLEKRTGITFIPGEETDNVSMHVLKPSGCRHSKSNNKKNEDACGTCGTYGFVALAIRT